jgi:mono/diheme cytochrome c family protein
MRRTVMLFALFAIAWGVAFAQLPRKMSIQIPPSPVQFKPGPNLATVQANCLVCHSAEYVYNQPPLTRAVWTAEVNKMRNAYKAQIQDADVDKIVDYLMTQNGKT